MPNETKPKHKLQAYGVDAVLKTKINEDVSVRNTSESEVINNSLSCYFAAPNWVREHIRGKAITTHQSEQELLKDILTEWASSNGATPPTSSPDSTDQLKKLAKDPQAAANFFQSILKAMEGNVKTLLPSFGL